MKAMIPTLNVNKRRIKLNEDLLKLLQIKDGDRIALIECAFENEPLTLMLGKSISNKYGEEIKKYKISKEEFTAIHTNSEAIKAIYSYFGEQADYYIDPYQEKIIDSLTGIELYYILANKPEPNPKKSFDKWLKTMKPVVQ